ncbi:GerMN domain-containing protein [Varibaculum cambriense]|nr:GerMN domain-containing protein [Varibaculum cambriense]
MPRKNILQYLLTALFSAPTHDLEDAVSAPEPITKIPSNLVTVQGRKAMVELPDTLRLRSETEMIRLYQQLRATLLDVAGIDEVTVSQNGKALPDPSEQPAPVKKQTMLGVKNGEVIEESDTRSGVFTAAQDLAGEITWPTPGPVGTDFQVAIRGGTELVRLQRGKAPQVLYRGKNLRIPQVDPWGWA